MRIYIFILILANVLFVVVSCQQKSAKRSIEVPEIPPEVPVGGHWRTRSEWKAHWAKHWIPKTIYIPVWKKVWTPLSINEWVPYTPALH